MGEHERRIKEKAPTPLKDIPGSKPEPVTVYADFSDGEAPLTSINMESSMLDRVIPLLKEKGMTVAKFGAGVIFVAGAVATTKEVKKRIDARNTSRVELSAEKKEHFDKIIEEYMPVVYSFLYYGLDRNIQDAEDLTQNVFDRAYKNYSSFKPREDLDRPEYSWLMKIAYNLMLNHHRDSARRYRNIIEIDAYHDGEENSLFSTTHGRGEPDNIDVRVNPETEKLRKIVSGMSNTKKLLIFLKSSQQLTNKEIGYVMGRTEGAVKSLYRRLLLELSEKMDKEEDSPETTNETDSIDPENRV